MRTNQSTGSSWKQLFQFTKDGQVKSQDLLYGFFLGVGTIALSFIISNRLTIWFETWFSTLSRQALNALDIAVPTILCMLVCLLLFRLIRKKRIVLSAYWIAFILVAVFLVGMLFLYEKEILEVLLLPMISIFAVPTGACAALATLLYARWRRRNPDPIKDEENALAKEEEKA